MLVRDLGSELDPPLATPPLPWLQPEGSMEAVRALRPQELHCDGSTVSLLDTVLQKNSATTKLSENVYIHKPTRRERAKRGDERQLDDSSVPLSVTQLNHQDYIINTDGVMTQTGAGDGEFMPMPEWLQESSYCHLRRGRFSCFLWGIFNKWLHAARRNKFVRTRAIIGQRWLQLRPTFGETLLDVLGRCVSEAQSPPSKTLAVRRHSRANVPELSKSLQEQRIAVHESFVEMVEQCSRLLERVASEVKAGEMRRKAEAIEKAQAAEFHKWKKYAKDAAKIPGRPSSKHYGPNNRLQPKPPQIHPLHRPLEPELDTTLLPRFIRLCDFLCVHRCVSELLRHHCGYLVSQLQESSRAKTDSVRAVATFNAPALAAQARSAAETLRAMGADDAHSIDAAAEEQEGRLGSALYFEPSVRVFHQCISEATQDFVARFNEPRLIFYEGFQESLKDIVSFHEMNQIQSIEEVLPRGFLGDALLLVSESLEQSFVSAQLGFQHAFDGVEEFHLVGTRKLQALRQANAASDIAHLPKTLRLCQQWRKRVSGLGSEQGGVPHVSAGAVWVDATRMQEELSELLVELFHEAQWTLERILDQEAATTRGALHAMRERIHEAMQAVSRARSFADEPPSFDDGDAGDLATRPPGVVDAQKELQRVVSEGWELLGQAKTRAETLDTLLLWLNKPTHWMPDQIKMISTQTAPGGLTTILGQAELLKHGHVYTKKTESLDSPDLDDVANDSVYRVTTYTHDSPGAGTTADISIQLVGSNGCSERQRLISPDGDQFEQGRVDVFELEPVQNLGQLQQAVLFIGDGKGSFSSHTWMLERVEVVDTSLTSATAHDGCNLPPPIVFPCNHWLEGQATSTVLDATHESVAEFESFSMSTRGKVAAQPKAVHSAASKGRMLVAPVGGGALSRSREVEEHTVREKVRIKSWAGPRLVSREIVQLEALVAQAVALKRGESAAASAGVGLGAVDVEVESSTITVLQANN